VPGCGRLIGALIGPHRARGWRLGVGEMDGRWVVQVVDGVVRMQGAVARNGLMHLIRR
jgi:hypothetical protein